MIFEFPPRSSHGWAAKKLFFSHYPLPHWDILAGGDDRNLAEHAADKIPVEPAVNCQVGDDHNLHFR